MNIHDALSGSLHSLLPLSAGVTPDVPKAAGFSVQTPVLKIKPQALVRWPPALTRLLHSTRPYPVHAFVYSFNSCLPWKWLEA